MSKSRLDRFAPFARQLLGIFHLSAPLIDASTRRTLRALVPFSDGELRGLIQEGHERNIRGGRVAVWDARSLPSWAGVCLVLCLLFALVGALASWSGLVVSILILGTMIALQVTLARGPWFLLNDPRALDYAITVKESLVQEAFNANHFKSLIELRQLRREQAHAESMMMELDRVIAFSPSEVAETLRLERLHYERFGAVADDQMAQLRLEQTEARRLQQEILDLFLCIRLRMRTADTEAVLLHARDSALAAELTVAATEVHWATCGDELTQGAIRIGELEAQYRRHQEEVELVGW